MLSFFEQKLISRGWVANPNNSSNFSTYGHLINYYTKNNYTVKYGLLVHGNSPMPEFNTKHIVEENGEITTYTHIGFPPICSRLINEMDLDEIIDYLERGEAVPIKSLTLEQFIKEFSNKN